MSDRKDRFRQRQPAGGHPYDKQMRKDQIANDQQENVQLLDPIEFCRLLLSRRHLVRRDRTNAGARTVVDRVSGKRYQVDAGHLDRFIESLAG
jgi:hypothetical protein